METKMVVPVIDIEASGFGPTSYPIEIGLVLPNGATYQTLVKPLANWTHWATSAQQIHGITRAELLLKGKHIHRTCIELNTLCEGMVLYTDCWGHDYHWLAKLFDTAGIHCLFRLSPIDYILTFEQMDNWGKIKRKQFKYSKLKNHRALNDAIVISQALEASKSQNINITQRRPLAFSPTDYWPQDTTQKIG